MGNGTRGFHIHVVGTALALVVAAFSFQNCGIRGLAEIDLAEIRFEVNGSTQGNGSGYDGKLYVHLPEERTCAGDVAYDRAIAGRGGKFYLTRDDCRDIDEADQAEIEVVTNPVNPTRIYYQGQIFQEQLDGVHNLQVSGTGFVSAGSTYSVADRRLQSEGNYVGRFDAEGKPVWVHRFNYPLEQLNAHTWMQPLSDGGLVLNGGYYYTAPSPEIPTSWITRFSADGRVTWTKRLDQDGAKAVRVAGMAADASDNIYLALSYEREGLPAKAAFAKLDPAGRLLFARTFDGDEGSVLKVLLSPTGGIYLMGRRDAKVFLIRVSSEGQILFSKTYGDLSGSGSLNDPFLTFGSGGALLLSGNIVVPDTTYPQFNHVLGRVLELNANGGLKAVHRFTRDATISQQPHAIADGGFVFSFRSQTSITLVRLRNDMSVEWARQKVEPAGFILPSLVSLRDGRFLLRQSKVSSLGLYWSDLLAPFDLARPELSCPDCTSAVAEISLADDAGDVVDGPELVNYGGLVLTDAAPARFEPVIRYLPFESRPR